MATGIGTEREAFDLAPVADRAEARAFFERPWVLRLVSIIIFALAWEIAGRIPISFAFPTFTATVGALFELTASGELPLAYVFTLQPLILGVVFSAFLGVGLGVLCGLWRPGEFMAIPVFIVFQAAPVAALIPLVTFVYGIGILAKTLAVMLLALPMMIGLSLFVQRTRLGKAMRATAQDREAAAMMGININQTIAATFFIGALLAGAGGLIWGLYFNNMFYQTGFRSGLIAFTAAVFGGIGNIPGAALGGMLIGLISAYSDSYVGSKWTEIVIFGILIAVLVFKPTGLLGMRVPEK
jgi:branched-subunit amino acid ABC-type transport system permease component